MIATAASAVAIAVAGCAGDGDGGPTPTGVDGTPGSSGTGSGGGSAPQSTIPGQVVHNELEGIGVTDHWYDGEFLHIQIRNERSEALEPVERFLSAGDHVIGRGLSEDGEQLRLTTWTGVDRRPGPSTIETGGETVIGFPIASGSNPARYEICLANKSYGSSSWSELCG
jgi:hypothetical protein